ncbi:ATP-binding protein [Peterkaempfera sp. SMS 1(5)a]|uniref:ATP-binding protein n=1 Tax=Peterkaempfera podocarpi TaxID=3232308 RepID=UPI003671DF34
MTPEEKTLRTWDLRLEPIPVLVSQARRQARAELSAWGLPDEAVDTAVLIVSELVTNAFRACAAPEVVHVRVVDEADGVLVEVGDPSAQHPKPMLAALDDENGRGLLLVQATSAAFGVRDHAAGKTVWARVAVAGAGRGQQ